MRHVQEIRDPIHVFVRMDGDERRIVDFRPFQRLRHIHQLAMTYLVYPGATHKRFEHSLGVMELSSRVFDTVTEPANVTDEIRALLPPLTNRHHRSYWRRVVRIAALCHDIGHLPFSHVAEKELLPDDWDHERLTREIIASDEMREVWDSITPPIRHKDIEKLAVGPKKARDLTFSDWETILSEIIVGDAFGVDRMDYLLRDSHHTGVDYGKFDHHRLISMLRILPTPESGSGGASGEPVLGMAEGGIQSAEALMLARYFMYSQVYFHPVRRIYDIHLLDFLKEWLPKGMFSTKLVDHMKITDDEIAAALRDAASNEGARGHLHARRLMDRQHFRRIYERNPGDVEINPDAGSAIFRELESQFGTDNFRHDRFTEKRSSAPDFPVKMRDGRTDSSLNMSVALNNIPVVSVDHIYANPEFEEDARSWLEPRRREIIEISKEGEDGQAEESGTDDAADPEAEG